MLQRASNTVLSGSDLITIESPEINAYFIAKRATDIVLGFVALVLALPILVASAVIIKLSSKGPILYVQIRSGKDGKPFRMWKLRTMRTDAEKHTGAVWAVDDDPRVVKGCRWMRGSHVDELPQLFNVIVGQMSLVGPRPERPEILAGLCKFILGRIGG